MARTESHVQFKQGDPAPAFSLPGINGKTHSLEGQKGKKGLLVIFMCNHCPYVKARMGEMAALQKEFGGKVAIVGINSSDPEYPGEGEDNMKAFAKEYDIAFPYLVDESGVVAKAYGATCTPDPLLFDKDMKLVFHGRISDALEPSDVPQEFTMKENITKLLTGEAIDEWFNPSLGCSIKFKK